MFAIWDLLRAFYFPSFPGSKLENYAKQVIFTKSSYSFLTV